MAGLSTSLSIAVGALSAQEQAIQTADNNIANAGTPGYTRETLSLSEAGSIENSGVLVGTGVTTTGTTSVRDALLNLQIQQQTSAQSSTNTQQNVLSTVQTLFPNSESSIGTEMSAFFTSLSALSSSPSSSPDRQNVLDNAANLVDAFHSVAGGLSTAQQGLNTQVSGDVTRINQLSSQIAALNPKIAVLQVQGKDGGVLLDQRDELESQLAEETNISVISTPQGDTVTTGNGAPLVVGSASYALRTTTNSSGTTAVLDSNNSDITSTISGGDLGGAIEARDTTIPGIAAQVDTLAYGFASAFNAAQGQGYDLDGNAGGALFTLPPTAAGAAASISLRTNNPAAIAASSDASAGSNGNVANLTGVESTALASGQSPANAYAGIVDTVGNAVSDVNAESSALSLNLTQLKNQQSSVSGVSTDEESSNLIRYQQAYEAAAEVVTTVQSLMSATMNMMNGAG